MNFSPILNTRSHGKGIVLVTTTATDLGIREGSVEIALAPHSVNLIELIPRECVNP